jgi:hypothetical protein
LQWQSPSIRWISWIIASRFPASRRRSRESLPTVNQHAIQVKTPLLRRLDGACFPTPAEAMIADLLRTKPEMPGYGTISTWTDDEPCLAPFHHAMFGSTERFCVSRK